MKDEDLPEVMLHFNGLNHAYLTSLHGRPAESQAAAKTFYEHRDWLQRHGIKVRLSPQGIWAVDEDDEDK